jgi:hypothetical protein
MNSLLRQYIFGGFFILFGIYQFTRKDHLEVALYFTAGAAFIFNALAREPKLVDFKTILVVVTWSLIFGAGVLFLYVLQFKF